MSKDSDPVSPADTPDYEAIRLRAQSQLSHFATSSGSGITGVPSCDRCGKPRNRWDEPCEYLPYAAAHLLAEDVLTLLAVGERDKAEIEALKCCPAGSRCAINAGAVHCFHCRRNWPRDETWEQPFLDRPDLMRRTVEGLSELLDTADAERVRDGRQIAQLTEALEELSDEADEPWVREVARDALKAIRTDPAAVLADEEDAE